MEYKDMDLESEYLPIVDPDDYQEDYFSPMEMDILKVVNTYLTIMKYLLHKPRGRKKELKENVKKIEKIKEAVMERDGSVKKYLDKEGPYYDLL